MPEELSSSHPNGAPCWFELGTSDQQSGNHFYKALFGWEIHDVPLGENMVYSIYKIGGRDVAAGYTLMPDMVKAGVPPHWNLYFKTEDADATVARAVELGGSVEQPVFDVFEQGRMAVLKDTGGALFCVWQPKKHPGTTVFGQVNAVCWAELASRAAGSVAKFYTDLFGWSTQASAGQPVEYVEFTPSGSRGPTGGIIQMDDQWEGIPSHWGVYFRVNDCNGTVEQIKQLGGRICHGPFEAPNVGNIAVCADPQGAMFSIVELKM